MFIAHLPSGYILAKLLEKKFKQNLLSKKVFFIIVMIGAVFPDIDLIYFYLFDNRSVHHHKYFLYWFSFWVPIFLMSYFYFKRSIYSRKFILMVMLFSGAALLHIGLDTFVGDVWLFAPFIDQPYVFFEVTSRYQPWWLNFILHWSFLVELILCLIALWIYWKDRT